MAVVELKKAELYYHKSVREEVAAILQESRVCQIVETPDQEMPPKEVELRLQDVDNQITKVRFLIRALADRYDDPISAVDRMFGDCPLMSMSELQALAEATDLTKLADVVQGKEHALNEALVEMSQLSAEIALLNTIQFFEHPLSLITEGTERVRAALFSVKQETLDAVRAALGAFAVDTENFFAPSHSESGELFVVVLASRESATSVFEAATRAGATAVDVPSVFKKKVAEELLVAEKALNAAVSKKQQLDDELDLCAVEWMPTVQRLSDYWQSLAARYRFFSGSDSTQSVLRTCFWLPASSAKELQRKLEGVCQVVALELHSPSSADAPPTQLVNTAAIRPFDVLTNLYAPPVYNELDPTPFLAPFFFLFFGMCLGDAGYGLVVLGVVLWVLKKYRRIPSTMRNFTILFAFCSLSTFAYGVISGSFFGNFIEEFLPSLVPLRERLMLVDPMSDPMQVLGISLLLGVIHLMFGLAIAAYDKCRSRRYVEALGEHISWIFFVTGLCFFGVALAGMLPSAFVPLGKVMTVAGALVIFWYAGREKQNIFSKVIAGFLALYSSTSYLGDILSYSRLLALGFGSAVIAMIVNLLGGMSAGIPYVGWLVAVVVIVGGHLFSILINILGAFVHPLRLQYVEFFGKFYSGGGTPYSPLDYTQEYIEISGN